MHWSGRVALPPEQTKFSSTRQSLLQPSPSIRFPSSHSSDFWEILKPLPQFSVQVPSCWSVKYFSYFVPIWPHLVHFPLIRVSESWHFVHSLSAGPVHSAQLASHRWHLTVFVVESKAGYSPRKQSWVVSTHSPVAVLRTRPWGQLKQELSVEA